MNLLFVCNQNKHRSKTAEVVFKDRFETKSAGLFNEKPLSPLQLNWADTIFVMEDRQRTEIAKRFPKEYMNNKIISLDIPDQFSFNQPELIHLLETQLSEYI